MKKLICFLIAAVMMLSCFPVLGETQACKEAAYETRIDEPERPAFVALLLAIAESELGYVEGTNNETKFGQWAGDPYAAWCAEFICWCVDQTDERHELELLNQVYPRYSGQNTGRDWYIARGRFVYRKGVCPDWGPQWLLGAQRPLAKNEYIPRSGDLMFFSYNEAGDTEHVALVEYSARHSDGQVYVHVIEGNNPDRVQRNQYLLDDSQILGFGVCEDVVGTTMRFGNTGDKVLAFQQALNQLGYLEERHITGTFGSNTRAAVYAFQAQEMGNPTPNGLADLATQLLVEEMLRDKLFHSPESWLVTE
ncbi:MAG: CHAP domain-containing protein [Clostridiales bacterium]|nr:CHAP domain-containing protein [Clostridiales bacterium]